MVPLASQGVQAWDRYAYVNNSPIMNVDPTGHMVTTDENGGYDPDFEIKRQYMAELFSISKGGQIPVNGVTSRYNATYDKNTGLTLVPKGTCPIGRPQNTQSDFVYGPGPHNGPVLNGTNHHSVESTWFFGISGSANDTPVSRAASIEYVAGDIKTVYVGSGNGISYGANVSGAFYVGQLYNIDSPEDYSGWTTVSGFTISIGELGVIGGIVQGAGNDAPGGWLIGYAPGVGASVWQSKTFSIYFPLR